MGNAFAAKSGSPGSLDNDLAMAALRALLSQDCKFRGTEKDRMHGSLELIDAFYRMTLIQGWDEGAKVYGVCDGILEEIEEERMIEECMALYSKRTVPKKQTRARRYHDPGWCPRSDILAPYFNYDFTDLKPEGESFCRGDETYTRPYGWMRYAVKVLGKYESDTWLGKSGFRLQSSPGEWPVSYHGTSQTGGEGIAEQGYDMARSTRFLFGRGIYSTPDPTIAELYAIPFKHKRESFQVMIQNRYDPDHTKVIENMNYLVTEEEEFIRPYGLLVKKV